jgi:hypothetical protein
MVNYEQLFFPYSYDQLYTTDLFLSKTHIAHDFIQRFLHTRRDSHTPFAKAIYVGMTSTDQSHRATGVERDWSSFALVRGKSDHKHADEFVEVWEGDRGLPLLRLVSKKEYQDVKRKRLVNIEPHFGRVCILYLFITPTYLRNKFLFF